MWKCNEFSGKKEFDTGELPGDGRNTSGQWEGERNVEIMQGPISFYFGTTTRIYRRRIVEGNRESWEETEIF